MVLPRQVYLEISRVPYLQDRVDIMINNGQIIIEDILTDTEDNELYMSLIKYSIESHLPLIGKGEAAAIVLSKKYNAILASNNLKDVSYYVEFYKLSHLTTAHILHNATKQGIINLTKANYIWKEMIKKKRKLPFQKFYEYLNSL